MAGRTEVATRPRRTYRTHPREVALQVVGWLLVVGTAVGLAVRMPTLPDRVPVHFEAAGDPDRWGSPGEVWGAVGMMVLIQALLTLVARVPHRHNYPVPVTEENAQGMYRVSEQMTTHLMLAVGVLTVGMVGSMTDDGGFAWPFVAVGLAGMLVATVVGVARVLRASEDRARPDRPQRPV